jgi:similar to stage IV sporulation protein
MEIESGKIAVRRNQWVEKGQTLVDGNIATIENPTYTQAKGNVWGLTWYKGMAELPCNVQTEWIYAKKSPWPWVRVFGRVIPLSNIGNSPKEIVYQEEVPFYFLSMRMPISLIHIKRYHIQRSGTKFPRSNDKRNVYLKSQLQRLVETKFPYGTSISNIHVLRYQKNHDKVRVRFLLSLEEKISKSAMIEVEEKE